MAVDYVIGSVVIFLIIWLYVYCSQLALWSEYEICKILREPNLPNLDEAFVVFGNGKPIVRFLAKFGQYLSYFCFVAAWFGYSCYDYHIISRTIQIFGNKILGHTVDNTLVLGLLFPPLLFLCCVRTLRQLVPSSCVGSVSIVVSFLAVVYSMVQERTPWQMTRNFGSVRSVAILAGAVLTDINGLGLLMIFKNELKKPKGFSRRFGILNMTFVPISCIYVVYILISCLKYGAKVNGNLFKNLPRNQLAARVGMVSSILGQMFQFPLIMFVPFDTIWSSIVRKIKAKNRRIFYEYALRIGLVSFAFVISASVPRSSLILGFWGAICASVEILVIPPLIETLVVARMYESKFDLAATFFKNSLIVALAFWLVISQTMNFVANLYGDPIDIGSAFWVNSSTKQGQFYNQ